MNQADRCITNVDDEKLIALIQAANRNVMFLAPGVSEPVARALGEAWDRLGSGCVEVVLDVDSEIYRLGYGTLSGLTALVAAATKWKAVVRHHPGVRIGVLVCDDSTLIYGLTPLLIEAGPALGTPNGVRLQTSIPELSRDLGLGKHGHSDCVVGMDAVRPARIEEVGQELTTVPPVKFDLARRVRIYSSRFQFVELEMTGCFVSRKRVPIPSRFIGLANNREAAEQFHARFNLVNRAKLEVRARDRVITEESLAKRKQEILREFVIPLKGYGSVVLRSNKARLFQAVEELRKDLQAFQQGIKSDLQKHMDDNADALVSALMPAVLNNPPVAYTKVHGRGITREQIHAHLERDIRAEFGQAADLVSEMKVSVVFKDVAYESLTDERFLKVVREAIPGVESLHDEQEAIESVLQPLGLFD